MSDVISMDDEGKSFADLLVASDHAGFISNSLDGITSAEIIDIFGLAAVSNYEKDIVRMHIRYLLVFDASISCLRRLIRTHPS